MSELSSPRRPERPDDVETSESLAALEAVVAPALRRHLDEEVVDVGRLAAVSVRRGRRLRTRRRLLGAATTAAVVGAIATVTLSTVGTSGGPTRGIDPASDPSSSPPAAPSAAATDGGQDAPVPVVPATPTLEFPVGLQLPGWTCEPFPADEKMACTSAEGGNLSIVVRPGDLYDDYTGGGRAELGMLVSRLHGNFFVTVQGEWGSSSATEVGAALRFAARWAPPQDRDGRPTP
ncbi:hypothetical protein [Nocardioides sp.]|uniref:hypothetical protein n=1 Tax=Nocardioides sp. TaxID=35761 RepID=UPI0035135B1A